MSSCRSWNRAGWLNLPEREGHQAVSVTASAGSRRRALTESIFWPAIFLTISAYGLVLLRGGYLHYEGQFFLSNYLDGRGFFEKVFSTHFNDWDCYQARELGFVFGLLDARAIVLASRFGAPFLYSLTSIIAIFAAAVMLWRLIPRVAPRLSITDSGLIVSLMLATPPMALSSYYYRPAKALVAVFMMTVLWQAFRLTARARQPSAVLDSAALFVCATLMSWSDPQGLFLILVLIVVLAVLTDIRTRSVRLAHLALLSALVANTVWRFTIGPRLSLIADGFAPSRAFERVALRYTFGQLHHYTNALSLWLDDFGYFLGSSGAIGGAVCLILIGVTYWLRPKKVVQPSLFQRRRAIVSLIVVSVMLLAFYTAMYAKLTSIVWPESRLIYYWIPGMIIIAIVVSGALDSTLAISSRLRMPVLLVLGVMIGRNIVSLPSYSDVVRNGEQRIIIGESGRVRDCMRSATTQIAGYRLTAEGAQACSSVRLAAFGSSGPTRAGRAAVPNPLLWCSRAGRR